MLLITVRCVRLPSVWLATPIANALFTTFSATGASVVAKHYFTTDQRNAYGGCFFPLSAAVCLVSEKEYCTPTASRSYTNPMEGLMQKRWKKQRRKREILTPTAEQRNTKPSVPPIRLEDRADTPEPPYSIARSIRSEISQMVDGRKTKRNFAYRNRYRFRKLLGLAYSYQNQEPVEDSAFVTPLTQLQHEASLPKSQLQLRFDFPHTLHYQCWWGPPQTEIEPNQSICKVTFCLDDMNLSERQTQRIVDIVGVERFDAATRIVCLEADFFSERNHNAAYLGDVLQVLIREAKKA